MAPLASKVKPPREPLVDGRRGGLPRLELREGPHGPLVGAGPRLGGSLGFATAVDTTGCHARMCELLLPLVLLELPAHPSTVCKAAAHWLRAQRGSLLHAVVNGRRR